MRASSSPPAFLDTNVLVYALGDDRARTPVAEALLERGGVISVQVLNELAAVAHRKLGMSWDDVTEVVEVMRTLCPSPRPIMWALHTQALALAARDGYHIYDALIVAAALDSGCTTLYSEDMQDGRVIDDRLTIRNPFT